jgi:hypothetical protein
MNLAHAQYIIDAEDGIYPDVPDNVLGIVVASYGNTVIVHGHILTPGIMYHTEAGSTCVAGKSKLLLTTWAATTTCAAWRGSIHPGDRIK